ncbi:DUF6090 family protein [Ekhidna sp.]
MLRLINRFKRNLLKEGKFKSFLLYTVGEVFLVVIGILIALKIDAWNKEEDARAKEAFLLQELHQDFIKNKIQFDTIQTRWEEILGYSNQVLAMLPIDSKEKWQKFNIWEPRMNVPTFNPYNGSIESIIRSSSIEVIKNDTLRRLLVSWNDVLDDYIEEEQAYKLFVGQKYELFVMENANVRSVIMNHPDNFEINKKVFQSKVFENIMIMRHRYIQITVDAMKNEEIGNHMNEILRLTK